MTTLLLGPADEVRRRGLRRMRAIALSLLLLAAVVFLLTLHRDGAWGFVNAAAEAAMVGALADWFAVTALFRHPLGLPVPHTAIIPTRKDALGQSLQEFVSDHFLTADVARDRVASADVARRAGRWLEDEGHSTRVVAEVATATATGLRALHQDEVRSLVVGSMLPRLVEEPLSAVAGRLLGEVVRDGGSPRAGRPRRRRGPRVAVGQPAHRRPGDGRPGTVVVTAVAGRQGDRPRPP